MITSSFHDFAGTQSRWGKATIPLTRMGFWLLWDFPFWGVLGLRLPFLTLPWHQISILCFFFYYPASLCFHLPSCKMGKRQNSIFFLHRKTLKKLSQSLYLCLYLYGSNSIYRTEIYICICVYIYIFVVVLVIKCVWHFFWPHGL